MLRHATTSGHADTVGTYSSADSIAAIKQGHPPLEPEERLIYDVARPLLTSGRVPDAAFEAARQALGEELLVELVLLVGQYSLFAMTVGAFDVAAAPGAEPSFPE